MAETIFLEPGLDARALARHSFGAAGLSLVLRKTVLGEWEMDDQIDYEALYGEDYYKYYSNEAHEPYERSPLWLTQFANLSESIIRSIAPKTAFDAGCAWGFLVESLRDRGVDAYGMDISSYAISNVRPDMQRYCSVGSLTEPIPGGPYDLVTCIEVLEHLPEDLADPAIKNLCEAGHAVLFSSSPDDFVEPTHFNVNPSIYWLRKFARFGFAPAITHDASYLTPHAVLLRRAEGAIDDDTLVLHARKQMLNNEVARLHGVVHQKDVSHLKALGEAQQHTHEANLANIEASEKIATLSERVAELEAGLSESHAAIVAKDAIIEDHSLAIQRIFGSTSWRITKPLRFGRRLIGGVTPLFPKKIGNAGDAKATLEANGQALWIMLRATANEDENCLVSVFGDEETHIQLLSLGRSGGAHRWIFQSSPNIQKYEAFVRRGNVEKLEFVQASANLAAFNVFVERYKRFRKRGDKVTMEAILRNLRKSNTIDAAVEHLSTQQSTDYATWIAFHDDCTQPMVEKARSWLGELPLQPTISIIMPTYKSDIDLLKAAVGSVKAQVYQNWELCIADDGSKDDALYDYLRDIEASDPRIKICLRETNGHISAASNSALSLATGEFLALMDHDDEFHIFALACAVGAINENPNVDVIYSDEDKIDRDGNRYDPYFKTQWNPDLLFSQNYVSHLGIYRSALVEKVGGFREGYEGSQDYDLLLRVTDHTDNVHHIPHILYHWRAIEGSTALDTGEKNYAAERATLALADTLKRRSISAKVVETGFGAYNRVQYDLPTVQPLVSLVVPTKDKAELLDVCIDGLLKKTDYQNIEVLIVDNNSEEEETFALFDRLKEDARVKVLTYSEPFNYSAINNFAVKQASGSIVGLINNDVEVMDDGWLSEMVSHALRPEIGAVGARLIYPDGRVQHDGIIIGMKGVAGYAHPFISREDPGQFGRSRVVQNYSAVTAAVLLVRKDIFDEVGGLDEENLAVAFNDVDFCLRIQEAGYRNLFTPFAELYHHESVSRGLDTSPEKIDRFKKEVAYMRDRWMAVIENDPYYNPNLSLNTENVLDLQRAALLPWERIGAVDSEK